MRALLVFAMMGWGLVWPLSKMLLEFGSPAQIAGLRYVLVCLCFIPIMLALRISFIIPRICLYPLLLTGALNALYSYLMYAGMPYGDSGNAGVITEVLAPIMAAFLWSAYKKEKLPRHKRIGLWLGVVAGALLVDIMSLRLSAFYGIYTLAALLWAILMITSRQVIESMHAIALNFYTSIITCIVLSPALFLPDPTLVLDSTSLDSALLDSTLHTHNTSFLSHLFDKPLEFFALLALASVFCTVFATTIFYRSLLVLGVVEGGIYALLVPVFSLSLAYVLLDEIPLWHTIIGGALAVYSIYSINFMGKRKRV